MTPVIKLAFILPVFSPLRPPGYHIKTPVSLLGERTLVASENGSILNFNKCSNLPDTDSLIFKKSYLKSTT